ELLVRERVKDMTATGSSGETSALTEARWTRFSRALGEFDGWFQRLRSDFGGPAADFVVAQGLVHEPATTPEEVADTLPRLTTSGFDLEIIDRDDESFLVKAVERETSAAAFVNIPVALLESPVYASVRRTYAKLLSVVGKPPFTIVHGKKQR